MADLKALAEEIYETVRTDQFTGIDTPWKYIQRELERVQREANAKIKVLEKQLELEEGELPGWRNPDCGHDAEMTDLACMKCHGESVNEAKRLTQSLRVEWPSKDQQNAAARNKADCHLCFLRGVDWLRDNIKLVPSLPNEPVKFTHLILADSVLERFRRDSSAAILATVQGDDWRSILDELIARRKSEKKRGGE